LFGWREHPIAIAVSEVNAVTRRDSRTLCRAMDSSGALRKSFFMGCFHRFDLRVTRAAAHLDM
jgi:hypothetical protein